ncbi:MAG: hypothetical protein RSB50_06430 [Cetobacterium sp.]
MEIFMKLRVTLEFRNRIRKLCEIKGKSFSEIVREYLEKEMKKHKI